MARKAKVKPYQVKFHDSFEHHWFELSIEGFDDLELAKENCDRRNLKEFKNRTGNVHGDQYGVIEMKNSRRGLCIYPGNYEPVPEPNLEEKTKFLNEVLKPENFRADEHWTGPNGDKYFNGWRIYRDFQGAFGKVLNTLVVEPSMELHKDDMGVLTIFYVTRSNKLTASRLINQIKKRFSTETHVYNGFTHKRVF